MIGNSTGELNGKQYITRTSDWCRSLGTKAVRVRHFKSGKSDETFFSTAPPALRSKLWMDEIHFAPPKTPWKDDSFVNANKERFPMVSI